MGGGWPKEQKDKGKCWEQGRGLLLCGCWVQALSLLVEGEEGKKRRGKMLGSGQLRGKQKGSQVFSGAGDEG